MRYFFNIAGAVYDPDIDGLELPDLAAARIEAAIYSAATLRERPDVIWGGEEFRVEVTDESQVLFTVITLGDDAASVR